MSHNEINNNNTRWEATRSVMAEKFTGLTQLHLMAESCTICSSRSTWPVRKLLVHPHILFFEKFSLTCFT